MFIVIFRAKIAVLDDKYDQVAKQMKTLAIEKYGCLEFSSVKEGNNEIAISYWENEEQIKAWKKDSEHILAQEFGRSTWYESYTVHITKVVRAYDSNK